MADKILTWRGVKGRGRMKDLKELFTDELAEVYDAEKQLTKALPRLAEAADAIEIQMALEKHADQTWEHVQRLEQVFDAFESRVRSKRSEAMAGLIREGMAWMGADADPPVKDVALILAAQKMEHYEIAAYGGLRTWAELLGKDEAVMLLEQTADEEKETDEVLNEIASRINVEVAGRGAEYEIPLEAYVQSRRSPRARKPRGGSKRPVASARRR
jgi:ferritin-like metal-binding protein YciE